MLSFNRFCIVGALMVATPAMAQDVMFSASEIANAPACDSAGGLEDGATMLCQCDADAPLGSVWGTDAYTSDSNVCAAAVHAGAVTPAGGAVVLTGSAGQEKYAGTNRNGVITRDWGSYGSSFTVATATAMSALATCSTLPSDTDHFSCRCPQGSGNTGRVWGYGPYTSDSDICSAARHTGVIGSDGGVVTVLRVQGLESYSGIAANGVQSSDWSSYSSSIVFDWNVD